MSDSAPTAPEPLDLRVLDVGAVNMELRGFEDSAEGISVTGIAGQNGLAAAIAQRIKVTFHGHVGDLFALLNAGGDLEVIGDVGAACGHSMAGGGILIRGHAGQALGAFARGGFIGIHGTAKEACGVGLSGADIFVRQSVGARAAQGMRSGNLVLGSDAGPELGKECVGGTIYLRGEAGSIAETLREVRMRESDAVRLGLLLVRAGIKGATKDFRVYRPRIKTEE